MAVGRGLGGDAPESESRFEPMQMGHAERLVPMIGEVLSASRLTLSDIDVVAVTVGPGSFTGTRISVATARALALASKARIVAASTLAVMGDKAARALSAERGTAQNECRASDLVVVVDARRGEFYAQRFSYRTDGKGADAQGEPIVADLDQAARLGGMPKVDFCGSGAEAAATCAAELGREAAWHFPDLLPDAADLMRVAVRLEPLSTPVKPLYLRPADAKPQVGKSIERVAI
ncbi:MAG: tRNA (adenosine(37)-N6)-threonylcarbamoyltransferase complex dimerization subunit type 1 TsaB [Hyphomicrobiaceae bacterium]|nr:tRNA (adenosine(37)-N6)-threonylcarbamoyltransferase complex dimerization subunit type 1 TsaB [Hyphomicrobiaceae bacterium]